MALSGKEFQEIQVALLDGYGDQFDLRQMVRFGLDESLDSIAGGRNVTEQVFNLVEWGDSHGRVLDLVRSAYEYNQGNEALKRLHDVWIVPPERDLEGQPSIVSSLTAQVFLSYSSQDTDSMRRVAQTMSEQGVSVWTDEGLEPGSPNWQAGIESALRNSECMVVLLSPDAKQSEWVNIEIAVTKRLGRRIFSVLIRGTHDEAVPISLETVQYIDARREYQQTIENQLVPSVARYLGVAAGTVGVQQISQARPILPSSSIEFDWVTIPAGEFLYSEDKRHVHLGAFQISRTLVTNRQYQMFVDVTGYARPGHWEGRRIHSSLMNHPVVNVSWDNAQAFCEWASVFLPTEQQWEKAARGTDGREYPWGNERPTDKLCNFNDNLGTTAPVGNYSPQGDSPYGVTGMAGNVWEWCEDWYASDREARVLRGGGWRSGAANVRCVFRVGNYPNYRDDYDGFRVVHHETAR